jgi:hypothetical protein
MKPKIIFLIISLALLLSSCAPAQMEPTALPTSVPLTETALPTETSTSTPEPTATSTPVPNGPCDNPLVPLVTGNQWEYLVSGGQESYPYTLTVGKRADIGNINIYVELLDQKRNRDINELVVCQEGAIDNFPLYVMSMVLSDYLDGILNTYKDSGKYAPSYAYLAQGNWFGAWQSGYLVEEKVSIVDPAGGSSLLLLPNSPIDVWFQAEGKYEPVTVPAGTFPQALVVLNDYTMQIAVTIGGINTSGELVIHMKQWYVPFVGLVRAEVTSNSMSLLADQGAGMPIHNVLELTRFTPGK